MTTNAEHEVEEILPLIMGGKIVGSFLSENNELFGFIVKKGKKMLNVWVDSDEEGNNCGSLKVEEGEHEQETKKEEQK